MGTSSSSVSNMAQVPIKSCEICAQARSDDYCEECQQLFCNNCKALHLRSHISRGHTFRGTTVNIKRTYKRQDIPKDVSQSSSIGKQTLVMCKLHKDELIYYCEDCEEAACKMCVVHDHRGHDMCEIIAFITATASPSSETMKQFSMEISQMDNDIQRLESHLKTFNTDIENLCKDVNKNGNDFKDLIDKVVKMIVTDLKSIKIKENARMKESINELKTYVKNCNATKAAVVGIKKDASVLPILKQMLMQIDAFDRPYQQDTGELSNDLNKPNITDVEDLIGTVQYYT